MDNVTKINPGKDVDDRIEASMTAAVKLVIWGSVAVVMMAAPVALAARVAYAIGRWAWGLV